MPGTKKTTKKKTSGASVRAAASKARQKSIKKKLSPKINRVFAIRNRPSSKSPHRSFRRTYRRDYVRPVGLPGYMVFTVQVWKTLWQHKSLFIQLVLVYAVLSGLFVGFTSQAAYSQLSDVIGSASGDIFADGGSRLLEAGMLLLAGMSGGMSAGNSEADQLVAGILVLLVWLVTIWVLRALLAGHKPKVRDGFYSAGAPVVPTVLLGGMLIIQLVPAAIAAIGISTAIPTGLVTDGVEAMLFWVTAILLVVLSLYWVTATLVALVIVTLPGMYPMHALTSAQDLVEGRRLPILLRVLWLSFVTIILWAFFMIPIILFDAWLKSVVPSIEWLPIVPVAWLLAGSASVVWAATYIYLLYRRVVDSDVASA